jgi:hypothetical protein
VSIASLIFNLVLFSQTNAENFDEGGFENDLEIDVDSWCKQNNAIGVFGCKELKGENIAYPRFA